MARRKQYTPRELNLLGRFSDAKVARLTGRTQQSIAAARRRRFIRSAAAPTPREWLPAELELFETYTDDQVARLLKVSRQTAWKKRREMELGKREKQWKA